MAGKLWKACCEPQETNASQSTNKAIRHEEKPCDMPCDSKTSQSEASVPSEHTPDLQNALEVGTVEDEQVAFGGCADGCCSRAAKNQRNLA